MTDRYRIRMKCIGLSCYLYFNFDDFKKQHINQMDYELEDDTMGLQSANGIWLREGVEDINKYIVHEVTHYIDWAFNDIFEIKDNYSTTEIRARLTDFLYSEIIKIVNKRS